MIRGLHSIVKAQNRQTLDFMMSIPSPVVVLASSSRYRAQLLSRILNEFDCQSAGVDEQALPGESPAALSSRLADAKAAALQYPAETVVIGSDQVAEFQGQALGKPGSRQANIEQLLKFSGNSVIFHTAVTVLHDGQQHRCRNLTTARFRVLEETQVTRYVDFDKPWDCAGGFKAECAAPTLLAALESDDPSAIVGLPLIWLANTLTQSGVELPV